MKLTYEALRKDRDQWKMVAEASRDVIQPQLRKRIAELEARLLIGVIDSDLLKTYDGSALERADKHIEGQEAKIGKLLEENARLEADNQSISTKYNAAVEDLKSLERGSLCSICVFFDGERDLECADCKGTPWLMTDAFKWRGAKGAEE